VTTYALVGDPHARPNDIDEIVRLFHWVKDVAATNNVDHVVIMGDLYDGHAVARIEVMQVWRHVMLMFKAEGLRVTLVSGNHDMNSDATMSWLDVHDDTVRVVSPGSMRRGEPCMLDEGVAACPFTRGNEQFYEWAKLSAAAGAKVLLCHQECNGCDLGNGFYSPNGFDLSKIPAGLMLVSGHIHKRQAVAANMLYVGSSRYLTRTDADDRKSITIMGLKDGQPVFEEVPVPDDVVEMYRKYAITQGQDVPEIVDSMRSYVDVSGDKEFVRVVLEKIPKSCAVRTTVAETKVAAVKESDGIPKAFARYAASKLGGLAETDKRAVLDLVYGACPDLRQ
jgi:hypothetical protein